MDMIDLRVHQGLRPAIPKDTHPKLVELLQKCWQQDPTLRPNFSEILEILQRISKEVRRPHTYITFWCYESMNIHSLLAVPEIGRRW